jgi:flagella basal body P-ring formation protein FlgA
MRVRRSHQRRACRAAIGAIVAIGAIATAARAEPRGDLHERIAVLLAERSPEPIARIELPSLESLVAAAAMPGARVDVALASERAEPGTNALTVTITRGEAQLRRAVVNAQLWVVREVVVAARALRANETLAAGDVTRETRELAAPRADALQDEQLALGRRLRRHVGAGEILRAGWLESAPLVRRGDRVTLRLAHGALTIETVGRAEEDGALGASVRVRNVASKRELTGRVAAEGVVHVSL